MSGSSIKTVLVLAVLAGVAYAMYVTLSKTPESSVLQGLSEGWAGRAPKVEIPGSNSTAAPFSSGQAGAGVLPGPASGNAPIWSPQAANPAFRPANAGAPMAPPFTPGGLAPPAPASGTGMPTASPVAPAGPVSSTRPLDNSMRPGGTPGNVAPTGRADEDLRRAFAFLMDKAAAKLSKGQLAEVHLELSEWYGDPRLTTEESRQLTEMLSQLAGTVIYSRQHLLEPPYVVQPGDTLEKVARTCNLPWQLLAKINGIRNPDDLELSRQLKVLRGPLHAVVELSRYELTLMLDGRYAGRFPIGIGRDCPQLEGRYVVRGKTIDPTYYDANQKEDPSRPLGSRWIDLGGGIGLHGTNDPQNVGRHEGRGVIFLADRDIEDLYDILTVGSNSSNGSSVLIRR